MACDHLWQVDAVADGRMAGDDSSYRRHLRGCAECRSYEVDRGAVTERLRRLPPHDPEELALRRLRARVLLAAAMPGSRAARALRFSAVAIVVVTVSAFFGLRGRTGWAPRASSVPVAAVASGVVPPNPKVPASASAPPQTPIPEAPTEELAGTVTAAPGARWQQGRRAGVERVSLLAGDIVVVVRKQRAGERFLVELPDGELEVRGTTFEVDVREGETKSVRVIEGTVEVRLKRHAEVLVAGQSWEAPVAAAATRGPSSSARPEPAVVSSSGDGEDDAYDAAVALYRAGQFRRAAPALDAFLVAWPRSAMVDDALFLEAVSLARAGDADGAASVAVRHGERFPASIHRKDAAVLVARAARARGDCAAVRRALTAWLSSGDDVARREAGGCAQ